MQADARKTAASCAWGEAKIDAASFTIPCDTHPTTPRSIGFSADPRTNSKPRSAVACIFFCSVCIGMGLASKFRFSFWRAVSIMVRVTPVVAARLLSCAAASDVYDGLPLAITLPRSHLHTQADRWWGMHLSSRRPFTRDLLSIHLLQPALPSARSATSLLVRHMCCCCLRRPLAHASHEAAGSNTAGPRRQSTQALLPPSRRRPPNP